MLKVNQELCTGCRLCLNNCPTGAINFYLNKAQIDNQKCIGCENCISICPPGAIEKTIQPEIYVLKSQLENIRQEINLLSQRLDNYTQKRGEKI
jgi:Fe-S-cluster-containing hydrogenase component 2